jgi:hypothetical protein
LGKLALISESIHVTVIGSPSFFLSLTFFLIARGGIDPL